MAGEDETSVAEQEEPDLNPEGNTSAELTTPQRSPRQDEDGGQRGSSGTKMKDMTKEELIMIILELRSNTKDHDKFKAFDNRNLPKPEKFNGKAEKFKSWHELFKAQLLAIDERWEQIILKIKGMRSNEKITGKNGRTFLTDLGINGKHVQPILSGMFIALLQNTEGDLNAKVLDNGAALALETYRQIQ